MGARDCDDDRQPESCAAPLPCARVVGAGPAVEDAGQGVGRNADARVRDFDHDAAGPVPVRCELDGVAGVGVLDRVFEQRIEGAPQRLRVGHQPPVEIDVELPHARRDIRPADEEIGEKRLDVDLPEG